MNKLTRYKAAEKAKTENTGELGEKSLRNSNLLPHRGTKLNQNSEFMSLLISLSIFCLLYLLLF
jgi:hypothetical protein